MSEQQNNPHVGPTMDQVQQQAAAEALNRAMAAMNVSVPAPQAGQNKER